MLKFLLCVLNDNDYWKNKEKESVQTHQFK